MKVPDGWPGLSEDGFWIAAELLRDLDRSIDTIKKIERLDADLAGGGFCRVCQQRGEDHFPGCPMEAIHEKLANCLVE